VSEPRPNFFIVGAAKAGTTTLYDYLKDHPEVYMPTNELHKEPSHFSNLISWYKNREKYLALFKDAKPHHRWIGEASTAYLTDPAAARNIFNYDPNAKIIIILRNPAERAYSMYCWMVQEGYEFAPSFEKALAIEEKRAQKRIPNFWEPQYYYNYLYFRAGLYSEQVKRYLDLFPGHVLVMTFEELLAGVKTDYEPVRKFLGVGPHPASPEISNPSLRVVHPALQFWMRNFNNWLAERRGFQTKEQRDRLILLGVRKQKVLPMRTKTRASLLEKYRNDIQRTSELIGKDLANWLAPKTR